MTQGMKKHNVLPVSNVTVPQGCKLCDKQSLMGRLSHRLVNCLRELRQYTNIFSFGGNAG